MPEPSHNAGDDIVAGLRTEEQQRDRGADEASIYFAAVESGPEIDREKLKKKGLGFGAWLSIVWLGLLIVTVIFQPLMVSSGLVPDPKAVELPEISGSGASLVVAKPPSLEHPFGLGTSGQDIFSNVLEGSRRSLLIGFASVFFGLLVGGFLGVVGGYFKGKTGGFIGSLLDILLAFPALVLALFVVQVLGHTVWNVTLALAIVSAPVLAWIARGVHPELVRA